MGKTVPLAFLGCMGQRQARHTVCSVFCAVCFVSTSQLTSSCSSVALIEPTFKLWSQFWNCSCSWQAVSTSVCSFSLISWQTAAHLALCGASTCSCLWPVALVLKCCLRTCIGLKHAAAIVLSTEISSSGVASWHNSRADHKIPWCGGRFSFLTCILSSLSDFLGSIWRGGTLTFLGVAFFGASLSESKYWWHRCV